MLQGIPLTAREKIGYEDLAADAVDTNLAGFEVKIVALSALIRSKQIADRAKDHQALSELEAIASRRLAELGHGNQSAGHPVDGQLRQHRPSGLTRDGAELG